MGVVGVDFLKVCREVFIKVVFYLDLLKIVIDEKNKNGHESDRILALIFLKVHPLSMKIKVFIRSR